MIDSRSFFNMLTSMKINFYTGVPDSTLKDFCAFITDNVKPDHHVITANEGGAIALAAGHYMGTGNPALVYMQNSGLGNAVNPLTSLVDTAVFNIPVLLLIGWRGKPGEKDEPQHVKMGEITLALLESLRIPYAILPETIEDTYAVLKKAEKVLTNEKGVFALIVQKNTFTSYEIKNKNKDLSSLPREEAIKLIIDNLDNDAMIISTTGKTSRELYEYREFLQTGHDHDFLTVGSMGHTSHIALGIALVKPNKQIFCFDGDGAMIMHMGNLAINGSLCPENFKHIVFNNGAHDSVGGQPTIADKIDLLKIAEACGYNTTLKAGSREELIDSMVKLKKSKGPALLEVLVKKGARKDLGRPWHTPLELKKLFMDTIAR